jgi:aspartyl-tRNA(Asn)/glutamyl-tRNA(Gln) amidotransferase subunit A
MKDNIAAVGAPLTAGSALYARSRPTEDATAVTKLGTAGAVAVAKLSLIELAGASGLFARPDASLQGATRNPWDPERWAGGSSGGSAAAVAAGLVPFAIGSETGGSMALPAAFCGVTAVRPSYGVVSRHGVVPLSWTLDKIGPMARTARDCAAVLEAIAGPDVKDPSQCGHAFRPLRGKSARETVARLRVGVIALPSNRSTDAAVDEALDRGQAEFLRAVGRRRRSVVLPKLPYDAMTTTIYSAEGAAIYGHEITSERIASVRDPLQRAGLRESMRVSAFDYLQAQRLRTAVISAFDDLFRTVDIILCFARTMTATSLMSRRQGGRRTPELRSRVGTPELVFAGNLAGLPSVYFPCGLANGLPVGLQLAGPAHSEATLLAAVEAFQATTDYTYLIPPEP